MAALVCYMIEAETAEDKPRVVRLPVRRRGMPAKREAAKLIRTQFPGARILSVRRSLQAHTAWAASGIARPAGLR